VLVLPSTFTRTKAPAKAPPQALNMGASQAPAKAGSFDCNIEKKPYALSPAGTFDFFKNSSTARTCRLQTCTYF
jgi:hypothetical protein